jgi:hypothetical protein
MAATVHSKQAEGRRELCGAHDEGTFRSRIAHLRMEHPAYARGLFLRVIAPVVFLAVILGLGALKAPAWAYVLGLGLSLGVLFLGRARSKQGRAAAGARPKMELKRVLLEGGMRFLIVIPAVALLIITLSRN